MTNCDHCTEEHSPDGCANHTAPMIHRTCTCRCTRRDFDPAPYWSPKTVERVAVTDPASADR